MRERVERVSPGTIRRLREGAAWIVAMRGDHDLSTAPDLVCELDRAFDADAPLVVDLTEVAFMDSAILNALLTARERALARHEGSFALVAPPGTFPSRVLALVVGTLIPTYPGLAAAVAAVAPSE
jgi:anti-sigma B factor antagonist